MNNMKNEFINGLKKGFPIGLGYLAVSFAMGIFCIQNDLSIFQAVLISLLNVTSAGQFAAIPIIASFGSYIELALTQFVINLRYSLMSISLGQKFDNKIKVLDRFIIAFYNTDEIYAVSIGENRELNKYFMFGIGILPILGWTLGTFLGALLGSVLPQMVVSALGLAIYAMFIAIVVPVAKKDFAILVCVIISVLLSCIFYYAPLLNEIPTGFTIILSATVASTIMALLKPLKEEGKIET